MAQATEWAQYNNLRSLIRKAIEDAEDESGIEYPEQIYICISPDLSEVYATFVDWWEDDELAGRITKDWHIELAESIDDVDEIASYYFDLR